MFKGLNLMGYYLVDQIITGPVIDIFEFGIDFRIKKVYSD